MQNAVSINKPSQLGIGYTKTETLAFITRVNGTDVPASRNKMLARPSSAGFEAGELKEFAVFEKMGAYELVDLPSDLRVMESGWVYDVKTDLDGRVVWKARFVAKGYSQVYGLDYFEVFSPAMQIKNFRTLLALHGGVENVFFLNVRMFQELFFLLI